MRVDEGVDACELVVVTLLVGLGVLEGEAILDRDAVDDTVDVDERVEVAVVVVEPVRVAVAEAATNDAELGGKMTPRRFSPVRAVYSEETWRDTTSNRYRVVRVQAYSTKVRPKSATFSERPAREYTGNDGEKKTVLPVAGRFHTLVAFRTKR